MNQETTTSHETGQNDLAGIVSRSRRHLPMIAGILASTTLLAGVATHFMPRQYTATTEMNFAPQLSLVKGSNEQSLSDAQRDAAIDAQLQLVSSLPVAMHVLDKANLNNDPDLRKAAGKFAARGNPKEAMAAALLRDVSARRVGQTSLFRISYVASDPLEAARIANAFAEAYLERQVQMKIAQSDATSGQLEQRVELLRKQAEAADAEVAAFRVRNNIISDPDSVSQDQEITAISSQLAQARGEAALARTRSAASGSTIVGGGVGSGIDITTISRLQEQRAVAAAELAGLEGRYGDRHPQVIAARERLQAVESQLAGQRQQMTRTAGAEASAVSARAASLAGSLAGAKGRLAANVRASAQLGDLERKAETARQLYQSLLSTRGEQTAQRALVQPDSRLVAPATPPLQPSSPNMLINLLVGMGVGLAIGLTLAFLRERWTKKIDTVEDIDRLLGVDFLNSIPTLSSAVKSPKTKSPVDAVMQHPMSAFTEAYRNLAATALFSANPERGGKVIGITSALPREGKTTTSIAMARVLAMGGTKVVLIDADVRRRSTTNVLAPDAASGWNDVAGDAASLADVSMQDSSGMVLLPAGPNAAATQRTFDNSHFSKVINTLRGAYDVIVIDTAPVLAFVDTRTMLDNFDSLIMLARWRQTPIKAIRAAIHQIETIGGKVSGVAMTMVNLRTQAQSGYGDASYYYKEMKDYYAAE